MHSLYGFAWRNLIANRVRTALSILAVTMAVAIIIGSDLIARSMRAGIIQSDELQIMMGGLINMTDPMMRFIGLVILLASGFLIFNTFNMSITRQRQQIGGLRALGMTRRQIQTIILTEALIIAVTGTTLGVLISAPFGQLLIALTKRIAGTMIAFGSASPSVSTMLWAAAGGIVFTVGAVWVPARRAAHVAPLDALRQPEAAGTQGIPRKQTALGAMAAGGLLSYVLLARPGERLAYPWNGYITVTFVLIWCVALAWLLPGVIRLVAHLLARFTPDATLRVMADNLRRARSRVTMTVMSFMLAVMVLIGLTGFMRFFLNYGVVSSIRAAEREGALFATHIDIAGGWGTIMARGYDTILLTDDELAAIIKVIETDAAFVPIYMLTIPELSFFGDTYFSYMINPDFLRAAEDTLFTFSEGDWDTALPIMKAGCGALVAPLVALRNGVTIGDTLTITGLHGPLDCTIAGIGATVANTSIVSDTHHAQLTKLNPMMVFMVPHLGISTAELEERVLALQATYPDISVTRLDLFMKLLDDSLGIITATFNMMLLLALVAAALAVINTMLISVDERRREIGLLRAVGTTQGQVRRIIVGEAALMGAVGGVMGCLAGVGIVIIIVYTYGVNNFGTGHTVSLPDVLADSLQPVVWVALFGMCAAPVIAALAAWGPAARILHEKPVESLALQ